MEMQLCEVKVVRRGDLAAIDRLPVMPTVCLVAFQSPAASPELDLLAKACLAIGTELFAMYGPHADALEDELDFVLEQGDPARLEIPTTSHRCDPPRDVARFAVHAAHPAKDRFRCLLILDDELPDGAALIQQLEVESSGGVELVE
jgi:hypothetical protein